ncbi:hypothetical protein DACRYDRAFT_21865 [Dacryopinax primogenitus]|uniref:F-box domain-containing protein n=1 Tax=Dacryopinax primogenitus (strain DJM 731) TaxID=1858805 RepID=M5G1I7_DACPD|nr:uncharacterized protein DACRYDRAFT_21865 [Dacryopinax primogenitus]EJU02075.1 hypothetical protein DACRYDRAFT_21865 [Dacryopinax primogenitus]
MPQLWSTLVISDTLRHSTCDSVGTQRWSNIVKQLPKLLSRSQGAPVTLRLTTRDLDAQPIIPTVFATLQTPLASIRSVVIQLSASYVRDVSKSIATSLPVLESLSIHNARRFELQYTPADPLPFPHVLHSTKLKSLTVTQLSVLTDTQGNSIFYRLTSLKLADRTEIVESEAIKDESHIQWIERVSPDQALSAVREMARMRVDLRILKTTPTLQSLEVTLPLNLLHWEYIKLEHLHTLTLTLAGGVRDQGEEMNLHSFIQTIGAPTLRVLNICRQYGTNADFLPRVLSILHSLTTLCLSGFRIQPDALERTLRAAPLVQELHLSECVVTSAMLAVLNPSLQVVCPALRSLKVDLWFSPWTNSHDDFYQEDLLDLVRSRAENAMLGRCRKLQGITIRGLSRRPNSHKLLDEDILEAMQEHVHEIYLCPYSRS